MTIFGACEFSKNVYNIIDQNDLEEGPIFLGNITVAKLPHSNKISTPLNSFVEARGCFINTINFSLKPRIENNEFRQILFANFIELGGKLVSVICKFSTIGNAINLIAGLRISSNLKIEKNSIIYYNSVNPNDC